MKRKHLTFISFLEIKSGKLTNAQKPSDFFFMFKGYVNGILFKIRNSKTQNHRCHLDIFSEGIANWMSQCLVEFGVVKKVNIEELESNKKCFMLISLLALILKLISLLK
jgi:phenylalanyl-tRNA synthetase beta chain